eukprot:57768-Hanusia_phi.AAC.1
MLLLPFLPAPASPRSLPASSSSSSSLCFSSWLLSYPLSLLLFPHLLSCWPDVSTDMDSLFHDSDRRTGFPSNVKRS